MKSEKYLQMLLAGLLDHTPAGDEGPCLCDVDIEVLISGIKPAAFSEASDEEVGANNCTVAFKMYSDLFLKRCVLSILYVEEKATFEV